MRVEGVGGGLFLGRAVASTVVVSLRQFNKNPHIGNGNKFWSITGPARTLATHSVVDVFKIITWAVLGGRMRLGWWEKAEYYGRVIIICIADTNSWTVVPVCCYCAAVLFPLRRWAQAGCYWRRKMDDGSCVDGGISSGDRERPEKDDDAAAVVFYLLPSAQPHPTTQTCSGNNPEDIHNAVCRQRARGASYWSKFVTVSNVRIFAELAQRYCHCRRNCSPQEQTTPNTLNPHGQYSQCVGDLGRCLVQGDGFLLQKNNWNRKFGLLSWT